MSGCAGQAPTPSPVPIGQSFQLPAGSSARLSDGLNVTFDRVVSDSRCPIDALCVRAGEAIIVVQVSQTSGVRVERELRTDPAAAAEASVPPHTITLVALAPYPRSGRQTRPEEYLATLMVETR